MDEKNKEPRPLGICGQLEKLCESICDNYCKYPDMFADSPDGADAMYEAFCDSCPIVKILQ